MYKNQLQELAQRSCFNLPSYSCIREGPDHAPRFKATVTFNGEVFESPGYHTTLRQAEHAAAEVALSTLSRRGPTQSLAARILDETGVCKNLLQETAQRAGVSLPVYTTIRSGPKHLPLFNCMVEVGGRSFVGDPAKTKKQAEKNAALAAWSILKHLTQTSHHPLLLESSEAEGRMNTISQYNRDERSAFQSSLNQGSFAARTRVRTVNLRDRNQAGRDGKACVGHAYPVSLASTSTDTLGHERYHPAHPSNVPSATPLGDGTFDGSQMSLYNQSSLTGPAWCQQDVGNEPYGYGHLGRAYYHAQGTPGSYVGSSSRRQSGRHHRRHSLSGVETPVLSHEAMAISRASGGGNMLGRLTPHPQQIRGLPYQSLSDRFDLNRPSLLEELQLGDDEDGWSQKETMASSSSQLNRHPARSRAPWQSQSERFDFRSHLLPQVEEVHSRDEEEWLRDDSCGSRTFVDSEPSHGFKEGWLRGETLMHSLEEQKNRGFQEGWLREEILKHSLEENRQRYKEVWPSNNEAPKHGLKQASCSIQNDYRSSQSHGNKLIYNDSRVHRETLTDALDRERSQSYGTSYKDLPGESKAKQSVPAVSASVSSSSPSLPFSSLWSKSTQWWGSRMPASPSSAAAALASTLGLRPATSMAPAVRVRQMVPVCSAPPARRTDVPALNRHPPGTDSPSSMADGEENLHQILNSLQL